MQKKIKLLLWLINQALRHENIWRSGGIAPPFLVSALDRVRFMPGETASGTQRIGGWVGPTAGLDVVEYRISFPAVNRTLDVHPIGCRYTELSRREIKHV
jgi:hypothetical protein